MKHLIERSYLVRKVQRWEVELPDNDDPATEIEENFGAFDQHVCDHGEKVVEFEETVEYDELKVTVVDRDTAKVIPISRKR